MKCVATLIAVLVAAGAVETAAAGRSVTVEAKRSCNSINLGQPRAFYKKNLRCATAKQYARRLYKTDGRDEPRNFTCQSGTNFNASAACRHDFKNKRFGWTTVARLSPELTTRAP
jgi:hypothetical protein